MATTAASADLERPRMTNPAASADLERPRMTTAAASADLERPRMTTAAASADLERPRMATTAASADLERPRMATTAASADLERPRMATTAASTDLERPRSNRPDGPGHDSPGQSEERALPWVCPPRSDQSPARARQRLSRTCSADAKFDVHPGLRSPSAPFGLGYLIPADWASNASKTFG